MNYARMLTLTCFWYPEEFKDPEMLKDEEIVWKSLLKHITYEGAKKHIQKLHQK